MTFSTAIFSHASKLFTSQLAVTDDIAEVLAIVLDSLLKYLGHLYSARHFLDAATFQHFQWRCTSAHKLLVCPHCYTLEL